MKLRIALFAALLFTAGPTLADSAFTGKDAAATVATALSKAGVGDDLRVSVQELREEDVLQTAQTPLAANAEDLEIDRAHSQWKATLMLTEGGRSLAPIKLSGHYDEMAAVPVLKRRVQSGEVISQDDIDWDKQPQSHLRKGTITDAAQIVGKSPKRVISQGRPIRLDEIASPAVINKGAQVTLMFRSRNLEIKTFGEALDSGAVGDVVRVRNTASKAVVQGTVESADRIRVSSPDSNQAEAM